MHELYSPYIKSAPYTRFWFMNLGSKTSFPYYTMTDLRGGWIYSKKNALSCLSHSNMISALILSFKVSCLFYFRLN